MKTKFKYLLLFLFVTLSSHEAFSRENNQLVIHGSYTFETYDGQENIAVYMSFFNNTDNDIEIESFSSNLSSRVEMHDIKITNDIAKMIMIKKVIVKKKRSTLSATWWEAFDVFWNK